MVMERKNKRIIPIGNIIFYTKIIVAFILLVLATATLFIYILHTFYGS